MSGISFLPLTEHSYKQAPYQDITKEEYNKLLSEMPKEVDWQNLAEYEKGDTTLGSQTLNCTGDVCEVVDIIN
jgi:ribonucleoside-diphosphate reductase alpha chain